MLQRKISCTPLSLIGEGDFFVLTTCKKALILKAENLKEKVMDNNFLHPEKKKSKTPIVVVVVIVAILLAGVLLLGAVAVGTAVAVFVFNRNAEDNTEEWVSIESAPVYEKRQVLICVEGYGDIRVELDPAYAPETVENFISLAEDGFYDGLTFHRIIEGFIIQGGDPSHDGTGGSAEKIKGEFSANGVENTLSHTRGVISMARRGDSYDSASSQFFILHEDATHLDGQYAAFGVVVDGMSVVDAIAEGDYPSDGSGTIPYEYQPVISYVKVLD